MTGRRWATAFAAFVLLASACSADTSSQPDSLATTTTTSVMVPADPDAGVFIANVNMTDAGFDPAILFLPAGRYVRLVLRNRGEEEHHYRVVGLIPAQLRWLRPADLDEDQIESSEEFVGVYEDDVEHVLHHLAPSYVPFKEESPAGIKPIGNEVHGYAATGKIDVVAFYALETGTYEVVDALFPEIKGQIIVFDPRPEGDAGS